MKKFSTILFFLLVAFCLQAQTPIATVRTMAQGSTNITIRGIVTSGDEFGSARYIQDATAGIGLYDFGVTDNFQPGDDIEMTGELSEFSGLIQLVSLSNVIVHTAGGPLPDPVIITPSELGAHEAELVQINTATFADGGNQFSGNQTYAFNASNENALVFTRTSNPLVGTTIPTAAVTITGISSQYIGTPQLLPRGPEDIDGSFIDNIQQTNITQTGFDISFETNFEGSTNFRYGTDINSLTNEINLGGSTFNHTVSLTGLQPTTFYYGQAYSDGANNSAATPIRLYSTASNSSGDITIYFNNAVDVSVSSGVAALGVTGAYIEGKVIEMIDNAQTSIDFCAYNINRTTIVEALNDAVDRGVQVRYVANNGTANTALGGGLPTFPFISVNPSGLMHNKFIIVDANSTDNAKVLTGSMNFTSEQIAVDYNHVIILQDEALAKAYKLEFEEFWGSTGPDFNVFNSVSGAQKTNNTPVNFMIDGKLVELHFTPAGNTANAIINAINTADNNFEFAMLTFTRNDIRDAIIAAQDRGVAIRGLIENINDVGGEYPVLLAAGVNVMDHPASAQIHHKYCIVDSEDPNSEPMVCTGSFNWSAAAQNTNDENELILHDATIANIFLQEFTARWIGLVGIEAVPQIEGLQFSIAPNPISSTGILSIESEYPLSMEMEIFNIEGKLMETRTLGMTQGTRQENIQVNDYSNGTYFLALVVDGYRVVQRFTVAK